MNERVSDEVLQTRLTFGTELEQKLCAELIERRARDERLKVELEEALAWLRAQEVLPSGDGGGG